MEIDKSSPFLILLGWCERSDIDKSKRKKIAYYYYYLVGIIRWFMCEWDVSYSCDDGIERAHERKPGRLSASPL